MIDSRTARSGDVIRRRRICANCGYRFTTYEEVVKAKLRVIKRDGRNEDLDRHKLISGIERACEKRPVSTEKVENIVDSIIADLENEFEREVPSDVIGEKVMRRLKEVDDVAYVRFASVYRRFKDVGQFLNEIQGLSGRE